jgi:nucleoside 2-deoxyribosyltransferase
LNVTLPARAPDQDNRPIIYLAGGFRSGWQSMVHKALDEDCIILDPSQHNLRAVEDYTAWDLEAIRRSDAILAYMENTNPAGYALSLEIGFAHALGKLIVLVDNLDTDRAKYFEMIREVADCKFSDLMKACVYVKTAAAHRLTAKFA